MGKIKKLEISVALGLIISVLFSVVSFGISCRDIRDNVIRLHILANSDSETDQAIKLIVRDELLKSGNEIFSGDVSIENAETYLSENKSDIIIYINNILEKNGFEYGSDICLVKEYFETRVYDGFTMPAGEYLALKVVLGKGEGHNWWCVMFPPLCLPAATQNTVVDMVFNQKDVAVIKSSPEYEVRFKIIEMIERLKNKF